MNCKRAEELMPLAGGDLETGRERELFTAHLGDCDSCRGLAREWAEAQSLLRLHAPPEFDAAFFDSIRNSVLSEITAPPAPPRFAPFFAQLLRPRALAYAATLALLAAAFASAVLFDRTGRPLMAVVERIADDIALLPVPPPEEESRPQKVSPPDSPTPAPPRHRLVRRIRVTPVPHDGPKREAVARAEAVSPDSQTPGVAPTPGSANAVAANAETARNYMRIELQTRDPNVRIIWLSPQPDTQTLKGTHDNR